MKTILLIVAVFVFPVVWAYLAEWTLRRLWPRNTEASAHGSQDTPLSRDEDREFLDFQI